MSDYSEFYSQRKPTQAGGRALRWWHQRMLTIASRFIPQFKQKTILEIGAGHGYFAQVCHQQKQGYCGFEMNEEQAKKLNQSGFEVLPATIPPIPAGNPVQVIWMSHVLEHAATYREAKEMLSACHQRLDSEGYVVIIAPDVLHWKAEFWSVDWSHGFPTSRNRVEQLLHEAGFSVHKSFHHTFTITNSFFSWFISIFFRFLFPHNLIDAVLKRFTNRNFAHAFMSVFGWRQIYLIARKE